MPRCQVLIVLVFSLLGSHALASTLAVTESGTFDASTPLTAFSSPGGSFSYSFDISSTPNLIDVSQGNYFSVVPDSFSYTLNGVTILPVVADISFYNYASDGGLFDLCITAPCDNVLGAVPGEGFQFAGPQIYSGPETNPVLLTGSFMPTDAEYVDNGNPTFISNVSPVLISTATPEPSSIALLASGLVASCVYRRNRRRL